MDVHTYFGLSYSNYLVLPRTLLQSMPDEWQTRFVRCLRELDAAFDHVDQAPGYEVTPADWKYVTDLTGAELEATGVTVEFNAERGETVYHDRHGNELIDIDKVAIPASEPIPHYRRGRTRIEPNLDAIREATTR